MQLITGGCACGSVRYELSENPIFQLICHCRDCQKGSGSEYAKVLIVAADRLKLLGSEPKFHSVKADSGRTMKRGFCEACGSPVIGRRPETPQVAFVQAGSLDDPSIFKPSAEVFTCRAHLLAAEVESKDRFEKGPPVEVVGEILKAHFAKR